MKKIIAIRDAYQPFSNKLLVKKGNEALLETKDSEGCFVFIRYVSEFDGKTYNDIADLLDFEEVE